MTCLNRINGIVYRLFSFDRRAGVVIYYSHQVKPTLSSCVPVGKVSGCATSSPISYFLESVGVDQDMIQFGDVEV